MATIKLPRFWRIPSRRTAASGVPAAALLNGLDAFGSEVAGAPSAVAAARPASRAVSRAAWIWTAGAAAVLIALSAAAGYAYKKHLFAFATTPAGTVSFETTPAGLPVFVAGKSVGRTPVSVGLAPGAYDVRLGEGDQARTARVVVTAGVSRVEHYEFAPAAPAAVTGGVRVQTDPARLPVLLDGIEKGTSPIAFAAIDAGDHEIAVRTEHGVVKRNVHVAAGETVAVLIAAAAPKADAALVTAGWLSVASPVPLQVSEKGALLGSSDVDRLMLSSGEHELEFANPSLKFQVDRKVTIVAGKTSGVRVDVPNGSISLNAFPWADVFIDGQSVGQTPIANIARPIGRHEVLFRNPQLGERRETIVLTTQQPVRLGVDLRKK